MTKIRPGGTYTGMMPTTLLQPKRMPKRLKSDMSRRYARLRTFFRTIVSFCERPAGIAFFCFFVLPVARPTLPRTGTSSKYGS